MHFRRRKGSGHGATAAAPDPVPPTQCPVRYPVPPGALSYPLSERVRTTVRTISEWGTRSRERAASSGPTAQFASGAEDSGSLGTGSGSGATTGTGFACLPGSGAGIVQVFGSMIIGCTFIGTTGGQTSDVPGTPR